MWNFCTELFSSFYKSTCEFSKKKSTIHRISQAHKTPSFHWFFLAVIAARSRPPRMNARMCVFPAARSLKNCEWCNKGTNRRQREAEAIRGCRKDIWLDWIPTAATLQRAALQTVLFYNTIQYNQGWVTAFSPSCVGSKNYQKHNISWHPALLHSTTVVVFFLVSPLPSSSLPPSHLPRGPSVGGPPSVRKHSPLSAPFHWVHCPFLLLLG